LFGVPPIARIAAVDVDRAEDAVRPRYCDLMFEIQAGQGRMIDLDVDFDLLGEPIALQEREYRSHIMVVLMLGRLKRLGLDENGALEADLVFVLHHHGQEPRVLIELPAQVGVQQ